MIQQSSFKYSFDSIIGCQHHFKITLDYSKSLPGLHFTDIMYKSELRAQLWAAHGDMDSFAVTVKMPFALIYFIVIRRKNMRLIF